ncbi:TPA: tetratricopeptide repeat protein [bacterium]|nr:tetratricopeptide repeat protein [bacterium]
MEQQKPFWKKSIFIIGMAGLFFLILVIIVVIAVLSTDPLREYESKFLKYAQDCKLTSEERGALDTFAQNKKLQVAKTKEIEMRILADKCAGKVLPEEPSEQPQAHKPESPVPQFPPSASQAPTTPSVEAKLNLQQGLNYAKLKDFDNAINEFTRAIEKSPNYATAYTNRAVAYMQQKKYNKAMDDLKKASEVAPGDPMVYYNFTALYSLQNQIDRSLDSLDRALDLGFKDYDSLRKDPDLNNVRKDPEFRKVLEKYKVFIK